MQRNKKNNKKHKMTRFAVKIALVFCFFIFFLLPGSVIFSIICNKTYKWKHIPEKVEDNQTSSEESLPVPPYGDGFISDLSEFEEYINPIHKKRDSFLLIINRIHSVDNKLKPDSLTLIPSNISKNGKQIYLNLYAAKALEAMFTEMRAQNIINYKEGSEIELFVTKGYISYEEQSDLFEKEVKRIMKKDNSISKKMAEEIAEAYTSRPGTDEHQSGLCVDICNSKINSNSFKKSEFYAWLKDNSWKFGFILRYPENKAEITGVIFNPSHFRYVGRFHASKIYNMNLCLEEYEELLK